MARSSVLAILGRRLARPLGLRTGIGFRFCADVLVLVVDSGFAGDVTASVVGSGFAGDVLVSIIGVAVIASGFARSAVDGVSALSVEPSKLMIASTAALTDAISRMSRQPPLRDRGALTDGAISVGMSSHRDAGSEGVAVGLLARTVVFVSKTESVSASSLRVGPVGEDIVATHDHVLAIEASGVVVGGVADI